ncbi:MAG: glycosyltransferase family 39 protein [Myxococcales bacterium]|nr:glycosyltransferase family 39 protein [Myxococcales bacterium]
MKQAPSGLIARIGATPFGKSLSDQRAGIGVCVIALVLYLWFWFEERARDAPGNSDPHYIWLYARSLAFDGDVDFRNDYALCGDPFRLGKDHGTGHVANPFYVGPSLFLAPALLLARALVRLPIGAAPDVVGGCRGPLAGNSIAVGCVLGALALFLSYRLARRFVGDGAAAVATALFGWAGLLAGYSALWPSYSHVYATFGVALVALSAVRAAEKPDSWCRWALAAVAIAVAILQRPPQLVYGIVPLVLAVACLRRQPKKLAVALGVLALGAAAGVVPLLSLYKYMYGQYTTTPASGPFLHLSHAHPFLVLFAPHGGLFYTTPVAWVAVAGLWFASKRRSCWPLVAPLVAAGAIEGFLNSAVLDWHGSGTFGARRLTALTPLFVVLGALLVDRGADWLRRKPEWALGIVGLASTLPFALQTQGNMLGQTRGTIPCCRGASQAVQYGESSKMLWAAVDSKIGDIAVYPAALAFAARYRVHPNRWRDATQSDWYTRDFRTLRFGAQGFALGDKRLVTEGIESAGNGGRLTRRAARVLFTAEWPFATRMLVRGRADRPTRVRVGIGRPFGTTWLGEIELSAPGPALELAVPRGAFGSGILELRFETPDVQGANVIVDDVRIEDDGRYVVP